MTMVTGGATRLFAFGRGDVTAQTASQCFKCEPDLYKKFEAMYTAKYGKKPPRPPEQEFKK